MKAGKAGQNLIIRDQIAAFENLWLVLLCVVVQKKAAFCVCERKMLLCKVQNSIASIGGCIILILLGSIFGMKSTFRLKKDFYLVFFFVWKKKNAGEDTYAKKELVVWRSRWISFLKRERVITQAKIGTFFLAKKNHKDKNVKTILFRP